MAEPFLVAYLSLTKTLCALLLTQISGLLLEIRVGENKVARKLGSPPGIKVHFG